MKLNAKGYAAAGVVFGLVVAGFGVASAQQEPTSTTSTPTTAPATAKAAPNPAAPNGSAPKAAQPGGKFGPKGFGRGLGHDKLGGPGGAIHGEFVVPDGNGSYRTMVTQVGEVTAVSSSSITLKSADGFSKKYTVDENTVVNSGRDGIGSVKNGDSVSVQAVVEGGTAKAMRIADSTSLGAIRDHWKPKNP
jgi:hypothetical protein